MTAHVLFFFVLALIVSCTKRWEPALERVQQECGDDMPAAPRYFKVLDPQGQALESAALYDVKASLRQGSQHKDLPISSRGCLAVPAEAEQIELQVLKKNWAAVEPVQQGPAFQTIRLRETAPLKVTLTCPAEGYWAANQSLQLPLQFESSSDPALFEFDLRAVDDAGHEVSIYRKRLGEKTWNAETALDLSGLEEKLYTLVAYQRDLSRQTGLVATRGCPLAILRQRPVVDGLRQHGPQVVKQGTILPWTMPLQSNARLHVCREPYHSQDEIQGSCQPVSTCKDPANFRVENLVRAEKAGLWKYFVYADDAALNTSDLSCQSLIISSSQPTVQIQWRDPEWNKQDEPLLKKPTSLLSLDISTFHPTIPSALLEPHLSCKVEFFGSDWTHAGKEVRCLSGACKDLALGDFQPCSPQLDLNIGAVLNDARLLDARMRVTVRVEDEAGGEAEASRDLWLRKSLWGFAAIQAPALEEGEWPQFDQIVPLTNQELLVASNGRTSIRKQDGSWQPLPSPFAASAKEVNFAKDSQQALVARFSLTDDDAFAILQGDHWQALRIEGWPEGERCHVLSSVEDGNLLCASNGAQILFNRTKVLQHIPRQQIPDPGYGCTGTHFDDAVGAQQAAEGTWYIPCVEGLLTLKDKDQALLENIFLTSDYDLKTVINSLEFDGRGRLWLILHTKPGQAIRMGYVVGRTFTEVPSPIPVEPAYPSLTFARNEHGDIQFQQFVWNDAAQQWMDMDAIRRIFPTGAVSVRRLKNAEGLIYETAAQALIQQKGRTVLVPKRGFDFFRHEAMDQAIIEDDGTLLMSFPKRGDEPNVWRMQISNFVGWGSSAFSLPKEGIRAMARDDRGNFVIRLSSGAFYQFRDAHWSLLAPSPDLNTTRTFIEGSDLWSGNSGILMGWDAKTQRWHEVWRDIDGDFPASWVTYPEQTAYTDAEGRRWFVKVNGVVVMEKAGVWKAWNAIDAIMGEDVYEQVAIVEAIDGRITMVSDRAIYRQKGETFTRQSWEELGYEEDSFVMNTLGHGFLRLDFYDETLPAAIIDLRRPESPRRVAYEQAILKNGDVVRASTIDDRGRLIFFIDDFVFLETRPGQFSIILTMEEVKTRFKDPDLSWDLRTAIFDPLSRSVWIPVNSNERSEVIQVLLPVQ